MPFVPVAFKDYLKKFDDVLTKKFKKITSNTFTVKSTDGEGVNIEGAFKDKYSKDIHTPGSSLKVTVKKSGNTLEASTDSMSKCSASLENTTLVKGLKLKAEGDCIPPALVNPKKSTYTFLGFSSIFSQDMFNGSLNVKQYMQPENSDAKVGAYKATGVEASVSAGQDGISVGGKFSTTIQGGKSTASKWGVGANVAKGDFVVGVVTEKMAKATSGVHYKCCPKTSFNLKVESEFANVAASKVEFGAQRQFNANTVLQAKVNREKTVSALVEYGMPDLSSKLQLAGQFASTGNVFGMAITYGEK